MSINYGKNKNNKTVTDMGRKSNIRMILSLIDYLNGVKYIAAKRLKGNNFHVLAKNCDNPI